MKTIQGPGGVTVPRVGLGTLRNKGDDARALVELALAEGFRHVDTGEYYGNEEPVGAGIARSSVPRDDIWLTTKILHPKSDATADVAAAARGCLDRLGTSYVDALLVHWPGPKAPLGPTLTAMGELRDEGLARTIGVSNFPSALLREALEVMPDLMLVQCEYHPYLDQSAVLQVVRDAGLVFTAHSPLALGRALEDPVVAEVAADAGLTPAQAVLRWLLSQDRVTAIPGGHPDHPEHLRENLAAAEAPLDEAAMKRISDLAQGLRVVDPPHAPDWD